MLLPLLQNEIMMFVTRTLKLCAIGLSFACMTKAGFAQDVGSALTRLLGQERTALNSVDDSTVAALAKRPSAAGFMFEEVWLEAQPEAKGGEQWECLTTALYFEARGETLKGQFAVAEVIMNRVAAEEFPSSVCAVVNQGTGRQFACQFTFTCDGRADRVHEADAWTRAGKIARIMLDGAPRLLTQGATHYHTIAVSPRWSRVFPRTTTIGVHHFYRMPTTTTAES